jgi:protocatechuate 3,4-dioxygenase beta subunit
VTRQRKLQSTAVVLALAALGAFGIYRLALRAFGQLPPGVQGGGTAHRPADQPGAPAASISGRVLLEDQTQPVEGATVWLARLGTLEEPVVSTRTDGEGRFKGEDLPEGLYEVSAGHEELVAAQDSLRVAIGAGEGVADLVLRLKRGLEVGGEVLRSDTGAPLAGVEVVFRASPPTPGNPVYPGGKRTGTTAADGRFSLKGLAGVSHEVELAARGFLRKVVPDVVPGAAGELPGFSLDPGYSVSGRVLDAAGEPAAGARVHVDLRGLVDGERRQLFEVEAFAGADGTYRIEGLLPLDTYTLIASHADHALSWVRDVKVRPNQTASGIDFRLGRGRSVRGRVLDEEGRPVEGATVRCGVVTCGIDTIRVLAGIERREATSGARGEYELRHLAGACYELAATAGGFLTARGETRLAEAEDIDLYLRRPKSLRGRVVAGDGQPLEAAEMRVHGLAQAVTDPNGAFAIEGIAESLLTVTALRQGYEDVELEVRAPREDVAIVLRPLAVVAGRVQCPGTAGTPLVVVRPLGEQGTGWKLAVATGDDGRAGSFEAAVPAGRYVVQADAMDCSPVATEPFLLQPGERRGEISLQLLPQAVVRGTALVRGTGKPLFNAAVSFRPARFLNLARGAITGADGRFEIDRLPAGDFELHVQPKWENPSPSCPDAWLGPFSVKSGEIRELVLELGAGGGLRGQYREGGEPPGIRYRMLHASISRKGDELLRLNVGPDGTFGHTALAPGDYDVSVWGTRQDGHAVHVERRAVRVDESHVSEVAFDEPRPVRVEGQVSRGGQPLAGITLLAMDPWRDIESSFPWWDLTLGSARTDEEGRYRLSLRGGQLHLLLLGGEGERGRTQVEVELEPPRSVEAVRFDIALGAGRIQGVVVEPGTGIPVAEALVELFDAAKERRSYLSLARARRGRQRTDRQGRFAIDHLPAGTYSARVSVPHSTEVWTHGIALGEGESVDARLELEPGIDVAVRLVDPRGHPVEGAAGILRDAAGNLVTVPGLSRYTGNLLRFTPAPRGAHELTVVHPRHAPLRIPVDLDRRPPVQTLILSTGGALEVSVSDTAATAVPGATVSVRDADGRDVFDDRVPAGDLCAANPYASPFTAGNGALVLEHLGPGTYRVLARKGAAQSDEVEVTVVEGETVTARLIIKDR